MTTVKAINKKVSARLQRERTTIQAMIHLYCRKKHGGKKELCENCREVLDYSTRRIDRCPFEESKPACTSCSVHCFKETYKEQIKKIMAFSGPRMLRYHPILALLHIMDKSREAVNKRKLRTQQKRVTQEEKGP